MNKFVSYYLINISRHIIFDPMARHIDQMVKRSLCVMQVLSNFCTIQLDFIIRSWYYRLLSIIGGMQCLDGSVLPECVIEVLLFDPLTKKNLDPKRDTYAQDFLID